MRSPTSGFRGSVITEVVAAVYDRRAGFFNTFGAHGAPLQPEKASCHTDSSGLRGSGHEMAWKPVIDYGNQINTN